MKLQQAHEKLEEAEQLLHCQARQLETASACSKPQDPQCPSAQLATLIALVQSARETLEMLQHEEKE
ncbi:MAG: hypothetical protein ACYC63_14600 [Armatimonadota bacterium]